MTDRDDRPSDDGAATAGGGTPFPVDVSARPRLYTAVAVLLAGPVISSVHFLVSYLAVEAGCSTEGSGFELFDPPVPTVVTLVATAVAALACLGTAGWAYRRWRSAPGTSAAATDLAVPDRGPLAFIGFLLSLLGFTTVLLVGLPALVLPACGT